MIFLFSFFGLSFLCNFFFLSSESFFLVDSSLLVFSFSLSYWTNTKNMSRSSLQRYIYKIMLNSFSPQFVSLEFESSVWSTNTYLRSQWEKEKKHLYLVRQSSVVVICNKYMYWCCRRFFCCLFDAFYTGNKFATNNHCV